MNVNNNNNNIRTIKSDLYDKLKSFFNIRPIESEWNDYHKKRILESEN